MSTAGATDIYFPIVEKGQAGGLVKLTAARHADLNGTKHFCRCDREGEVPQFVVMDARTDDPPETQFEGIVVRLSETGFGGESYGLALALADKIARFGRRRLERIVATGIVEQGGGGRITKVLGFDAKAIHTIDSARDGSLIFVYPAQNFAEAREDTKDALHEAARAGRLILKPASHVSELHDLWIDKSGESAKPLPWVRRWPIAAGLGAIVLAGAGYGWTTQWSPLAQCERASAEMETLGQRWGNSALREKSEGRAAIIKALEACEGADTALRTSGHAAALAAEANFRNSGSIDAARYWKKASNLGDKDGMLAYARYLLAYEIGNPASISTAERLLVHSSDAGVREADQSLTDFYTHGLGGRRDPVKARFYLMRWQERRPAGELE